MKHWIRLTACSFLIASSCVVAQEDTWEPLKTGTTQDLYAIDFIDADVGYVVGAAGTILKTTDGGKTWEDSAPDLDQEFYGLHFFDTEEGVIVGSEGTIERTIDGGTTWTPVTSGTSEMLYGVSFADSVGLAVGSGLTILRSEDRGETWSEVQGDFFAPGFFGVHMVSDSFGAIAGENSIFQPLFGYTNDGGTTFDFVSFYLENNEGGLEDVHFLDSLRGISVGRTWDSQGAIVLSEDSGETWTTTLFPETPLYGVDFTTEETGYAVGSEGTMLKTTDGGENWVPEDSDTSEALNAISIPEPSIGYAAGSGGTVLKGSIAMSSSVPDEKPLPRYALEQNYPNPFNQQTVIHYNLSEATEVTLRVYNTLGQEVATLAEGYQTPGSHEVTFDASHIDAGLYLYTLETNNLESTRKMLLLK